MAGAGRQFLSFVVAGGVAAAANVGARLLTSPWLPYAASIVLAHGVGMVVAFVLMRRHVFDAAGQPLGPQVLKFVAVNLLAVAQTLAVSLLLARWGLPALGISAHAESIAHVVGVIVPVVTSFVAHRHATFRKP